MLAQITKLLEDHNVPTDLIVDLKALLADGFQTSDVTAAIKLIQDNQDQIQDASGLIGQLQDMGGASGALDSLKSGDIGGAINKAKGMF